MELTNIQRPSAIIGHLRGVDEESRPVVTWEGQGPFPVAAQVVWMPSMPDWTHCVGLRVLLTFVEGDESKPVITGLLDAPGVVASVPQSSQNSNESTGVAQPGDPSRTEHIEAKDELVLQCGKARISLRSDGRIVIKGGYLLTRSTGLNKIKGASIQLN